jgi:hypothetical protein
MAGSVVFQITDEFVSSGAGATVFHLMDEFNPGTSGSVVSLMTPALGTIPDLLVSRHTGAGNGAVYTLSGGVTLTQIGSNFGPSAEAPSVTTNPVGRVLEFKGLKLVWHKNTIREENTGGTGAWGIVYTVPNFSGNEGQGLHSGLYEVQVSGVPTLIGAHQRDSNSHFNVIRSTDGLTWTVENDLLDTTASSICRPIVYRNELYWAWRNNANPIMRYSPLLSSVWRVPISGTIGAVSNQDFAVHNNCLFMVGSVGTGASDTFKLWKLQASFIEQHNFTTQNNGGFGENGGCVLFSANDALYTILPGDDSGADGNTMWKISNPGEATQTVIEITDPVIPAAYRSGGGSANETNRWFSFVNNDSRTTLPEVFLWRLSDFPSGTYECFSFLNEFTELSSLGTGLAGNIYLPNTNYGGGERITANSKVYAEIEQHLPVTAGLMISYRIYGGSAGLTGTIKLYYDSQDETPATQATLTGSATGGSSVRVSNEVQNVELDTAIYTLIWDNIADGVAEPSSANLMLDIS